jgi:hypothetical protein
VPKSAFFITLFLMKFEVIHAIFYHRFYFSVKYGCKSISPEYHQNIPHFAFYLIPIDSDVDLSRFKRYFLCAKIELKYNYNHIRLVGEVTCMTKLRRLREKKGLSIISISYETRIHPTAISSIERRKLAPASHVRKALCDFLETQENEMFDRQGFAK